MTLSQKTLEIIKETMESSSRLIGNNIRSTRTVRIGDPIDKIIYADDEKTKIYIHPLGDTVQGRTTISAAGIPADILRTYKRIIRVELADDGSERYVGVDTQYDEIFAQGLEESHDQTAIDLSQLNYGIAHVYSGMVLLVNGAIYGNDYVADLLTGDFATGTVQDTDSNNIVIPTTNNKAIAILIQIDPTTGILSYKQSIEFVATTSLQQQFVNGILPDPDGDKYRVCYGKLIKGASVFNSDNIWVVPEILSKGGGLWTNPIVASITIASGEQQHAIEQTIDALGVLTVSGEYYVDDKLTIDTGGKITIITGGKMTIRSVIIDQPSLISKSVTTTSDYTITLSDGNIFADASGGDITITLPTAASANGRSFRVTRINASGGNVIMDGNGIETINGSLTMTASSQWTSSILVSSGTDWIIG